jgi:hypothetical protein
LTYFTPFHHPSLNHLAKQVSTGTSTSRKKWIRLESQPRRYLPFIVNLFLKGTPYRKVAGMIHFSDLFSQFRQIPDYAWKPISVSSIAEEVWKSQGSGLFHSFGRFAIWVYPGQRIGVQIFATDK